MDLKNLFVLIILIILPCVYSNEESAPNKSNEQVQSDEDQPDSIRKFLMEFEKNLSGNGTEMFNVTRAMRSLKPSGNCNSNSCDDDNKFDLNIFNSCLKKFSGDDCTNIKDIFPNLLSSVQHLFKQTDGIFNILKKETPFSGGLSKNLLDSLEKNNDLFKKTQKTLAAIVKGFFSIFKPTGPMKILKKPILITATLKIIKKLVLALISFLKAMQPQSNIFKGPLNTIGSFFQSMYIPSFASLDRLIASKGMNQRAEIYTNPLNKFNLGSVFASKIPTGMNGRVEADTNLMNKFNLGSMFASKRPTGMNGKAEVSTNAMVKPQLTSFFNGQLTEQLKSLNGLLGILNGFPIIINQFLEMIMSIFQRLFNKNVNVSGNETPSGSSRFQYTPHYLRESWEEESPETEVEQVDVTNAGTDLADFKATIQRMINDKLSGINLGTSERVGGSSRRPCPNRRTKAHRSQRIQSRNNLLYDNAYYINGRIQSQPNYASQFNYGNSYYSSARRNAYLRNGCYQSYVPNSLLVSLLQSNGDILDGDIIILNMNDGVVLIGQYSDDDDMIKFDVIHQDLSTRSDSGVWNISYDDLLRYKSVTDSINDGCNP